MDGISKEEDKDSFLYILIFFFFSQVDISKEE